MALLVGTAPTVVLAQEEAAPVTIMTYFSADLGEPAFLELLQQFTEETGIPVATIPVGHEDFKTFIYVQLAGNNPPDAFTDWAGARAGFKVQNDSLAPIDEMWAANDLDSAFPTGMIETAATYGGTKYLVPIGYHIAPMWYNPKVMEAAGVAIPTTWDGLKAACETLKGAGITPIALGSKDAWPAQFWFDYLLLRTAGPEYRTRLMAGEASYTDPEVVRAMGLWQELAQAGCFTENANAYTWTDAADDMANGEAAMNLMGTWIIGHLTTSGFEPGTDYDFFEFPVIDEGVRTAVVGPVDGMVAAKAAKNPDGAMALLAFLARPEVQAEWAAGQGALAPNVNSAPPENPILQRALEVAAVAETFNFNYDLATPPAPSVVGLAMFQKFLDDPSDIEGLLDQTQTEIAAAFAQQ
jgi:multiple sugar transport system substrate-binding protein/raffinose/stachyose/melibiose transport system substrate-binding protein